MVVLLSGIHSRCFPDVISCLKTPHVLSHKQYRNVVKKRNRCCPRSLAVACCVNGNCADERVAPKKLGKGCINPFIACFNGSIAYAKQLHAYCKYKHNSCAQHKCHKTHCFISVCLGSCQALRPRVTQRYLAVNCVQGPLRPHVQYH